MSAAVVCVVTALDAVSHLDACSREEKIAVARKLIDRSPTLLPVEIADRIQRSGSILARKLTNENMNNGHRLAFLGGCVLRVDEPAPVTKAAPGAPTRGESDLIQSERHEMRACYHENFGHLSFEERQAFSRRVKAIEDWRRSVGRLPTPWWALQGYESPEAYASMRAPKKPKPAIPAPDKRRGKMLVADILDPILNDDTALIPPMPDEDEVAAAAYDAAGGF